MRHHFVWAVTFTIGYVSSHPGESPLLEAKSRIDFLGKSSHTLEDCGIKANGSALRNKAGLRRLQQAHHIRDGLWKRDLDDILGHSHEFTAEHIHQSGDDILLFSDYSSYMLQSETTTGPFYVNGELIRSHISEGQDGIPLYLDIQLIDTTTCQPIEEAYVDIWHCNATGIYSGVNSIINGDFRDKSNLNENFLRGVQATNLDGVVQFETIFPGHYGGMFKE